MYMYSLNETPKTIKILPLLCETLNLDSLPKDFTNTLAMRENI